MTTKQKKAVITIIALSVALVIGVGMSKSTSTVESTEPETVQEIEKPTAYQIELQHRRETWISALEWCESRGKNDALNPEDRDHTPSYSNFQWKPSTLLGFGKKYGLIATSTTLAEIPELLKDYELQRNTVRHMIDDPEVNWLQQFPDCVRLKVGFPPVK